MLTQHLLPWLQFLPHYFRKGQLEKMFFLFPVRVWSTWCSPSSERAAEQAAVGCRAECCRTLLCTPHLGAT